MPFAATAASSRFIVSFGPELLGMVVKPSAAIARSMAVRLRSGWNINELVGPAPRSFSLHHRLGTTRTSCFLPPMPLYWTNAHTDRRRRRCYPSLRAAADVSRSQPGCACARDQDWRRRCGACGRSLYRRQGRARGGNPARHLRRGAARLVAVRDKWLRQYRRAVWRRKFATLAGTDVAGPIAVSRYDTRS